MDKERRFSMFLVIFFPALNFWTFKMEFTLNFVLVTKRKTVILDIPNQNSEHLFCYFWVTFCLKFIQLYFTIEKFFWMKLCLWELSRMPCPSLQRYFYNFPVCLWLKIELILQVTIERCSFSMYSTQPTVYALLMWESKAIDELRLHELEVH